MISALQHHSGIASMSALANFFTKVGWYEKGISSAERKLIFKLDILILIYTSVSFFTKFLDTSALTNAYVSGMKEDLNFRGNQLNYVNAVYESCYCVFQIPINLLLTRYPASYIIPASEFAWGLATLGTAFVKNVPQLMGCRALLGLFAASNYIGCVYIISSWYKMSERGKRMALFWIANPLGTAVGGWVEAAIYNKKGLPLASWRFLFIICALITFVVSFWGFATLPNFPHDIRSRFLTEDEKKLALERIASEDIKTERTQINWKTFKTLAFSWQAPLFAILGFTLGFCNYGSGTPFSLFLKADSSLTVQQVNNIPTGANALALISALSLCWYSDVYNDRFGPLILVTVVAIVGNIILVVYDVSMAAKYYAFLSLGFCSGAWPLWQSLISDYTFFNSELRAYSIAAGNVTGEVSSLVVPLIVYKTTQAPRYRAGIIFSLVLSIVQVFLIGIVYYAGKVILPKQLKKLEELENDDEANSTDATGENFQYEKATDTSGKNGTTIEVSSLK